MNRLRRAICEKISQVTSQICDFEVLEIPAKGARRSLLQPIAYCTLNNNNLLQELLHLKYDNDIVQHVRLLPATNRSPAKLEFELQPASFLKTALETVQTKPHHSDHVVFDFSSPNIAKPFHMGHLRSTIIGNALSNLHQHLGHKVTKINYLGDWGTQFGLLQVGVEMLSVSEEAMRQKPIETLYQAYVAANTAAKNDASIVEKARQYFAEMEAGSNAALSQQWQQYRLFTVQELERVYARLGVRFHAYEWESQYSQKQITDVLGSLEKSLLQIESDGRKVVQVNDRRVPLVKSDGSTLYLTRDIAALLDRWQRLHFSRIYYVVENAQTDHFNALFKTTATLCKELSSERMIHVKFGRIHGMSTRSGNVVFLRDVLDEARNRMFEKQLQSPTTKIAIDTTSAEETDAVADVLGVTAVIINDLKQRRQRDYNFDWSNALQMTGDTGVKLQYTHCRLHNLLKTVDNDNNYSHNDAKLEYLMEPEAQDVIFELARFEQTLWACKYQLEACILVQYLFTLCNSTSRALARLNVKNETDIDKRNNRIILFSTAKATLKCGMEILGLRPLEQM